MLHERPLAYLATYIAAARARGRPTRLVLRNTERIGLVHLYFQHGRLVLVEGHRGAGLASLTDVASWQSGTIRQDDLDNQPVASEPDPRLEDALADVVRQLEPRNAGGRLSPLPSDPRFGSAASLPRQDPLITPPSSRPRATSGLGSPSPLERPPADAALTEPPRPMPPGSWVALSSGDTFSESQWQLVAMFLYQILERAQREVAPEVAAGLLVQAVARLSLSVPFLSGLEVDESGWLRPRQEGTIARFATYDVTQAIAKLITDYESRCALLVGQAQARKIITDAAGPLRGPLASLGLDISDA